jgi:hypothetical protein
MVILPARLESIELKLKAAVAVEVVVEVRKVARQLPNIHLGAAVAAELYCKEAL